MRIREVAESRVLWFREELVIRNLEGLWTSSVKYVLQVVLKDHATGEVGPLATVLHSHLRLKRFLNKL